MKDTPKAKPIPELDKKSDFLIKDFFNSYAKEDSSIKLNELLKMFLEKNLLSNNFSFKALLDVFDGYATDDIIELSQAAFIPFFIKVSKILFSQASNSIEEMLTFMLKEKLNFKNWKGRLSRRVQTVYLR